jgi:hypothetical protein
METAASFWSADESCSAIEMLIYAQIDAFRDTSKAMSADFGRFASPASSVEKFRC